MKIAICSDSSLDLTKDMIEKHDIHIVPFGIYLGEKLYFDGESVSPDDIFKYVEKHKQLPKTSAINIEAYQEFFTRILKDYDELICFCLSSDMSSSFNNAIIASHNFDKKVKVIDSQSLSTGVGMQVLYACELRDQGKTSEEIFDLVHNRRLYVQASFVVEKLDYLYKGGRCNSLQLLGANLLKIRPSILVDNGNMGMHKKYRGNMQDVVYKYINDTLNEFNNPDHEFCFITYSSATEEMLESAKKALAEYGKFKNVYYTNAGATITSHCGKNTLGILYYNDGGVNK